MSVFAPLLLAGLFSLIWSSPYALLIGVLAPTLALGHWFESRRRHLKAAQDAEASYQSALSEFEHTLAHNQRRFLQRALSASPHPEQWRDRPLWRPVVVDGVRQIRVGLTTGQGPDDRPVAGLPALVGIDGGIAVVGSSELAQGLWRVVVLGICSHFARTTAAIGPEAVWGQSDAPTDSITVSDDAGGEIFARLVDDLSEVPPQAAVVLLVGSDFAQLVVDGVASDQPLRPDTISMAASRWVVDALSALVPSAPEIRKPVPDPANRSALRIDVSPDHCWDLVEAGPHAVIWGQTGSGKSVLIRQIIHSIAGCYRPEQVSVVVIDFKGGVGSSAIAHYPHVVGVLSDLTPHAVSRVEEGLRAEMRRRESVLASARIDSISELAPERALARTVIIVDEVATLIQQHPQWEQLLSDIASRGRALGLHLISASQRVAGQIPRTVMVNSPLRVCLRVSDTPEAGDFLPGVPHRAIGELLNAPPGTALVLDASGIHRTVIVEEAPPKLPLPGNPQTLWCDPLPAVIDAKAPALAVLDRPDQQGQPLLCVDDVAPGLLWVSGESGRGLSNLLARWAEQVADRLVLPVDPAALVDTLRQLRHGIVAPPPLVVAEHLDRVVESLPTATLQWCVDALVAVARAPRTTNATSHVVVGTHPRGECASLLVRSADCSWWLAPTGSDKWRDYGLPGSLFDPEAPPGRLVIDDVLAQCVRAHTPLEATPWTEDHSNPVGEVDLVVSGGPHDMANHPEGVLLIPAHECDRYLPQIDQAFRRGTLGLHAVGTSELAPYVRHHPPLPDPGQARIWQVGANSWRLRKLPG